MSNDIELAEDELDVEVLTTDWIPGTMNPEYLGFYEWIKPCHNFWEFPKRPIGLIKWTENGWRTKQGDKVDFNPEEDMWRGFLKPTV